MLTQWQTKSGEDRRLFQAKRDRQTRPLTFTPFIAISTARLRPGFWRLRRATRNHDRRSTAEPIGNSPAQDSVSLVASRDAGAGFDHGALCGANDKRAHL